MKRRSRRDRLNAWTSMQSPPRELKGAISKAIMTAASERYREYLNSPYWQAVNKAVKERAGYRCQVCNSPHDLNAHHRTYEHRGNELEHLDDMVCLCRRCHEVFHGKDKPEPAPVQNVKIVHVHHAKPQVEAMLEIEGQLPDTAFFTLTREHVMKCRTAAGGFTGATLEAFGLPRHNQAGWIGRLVGKRIHRDDYRRALQGRYMHKTPSAHRHQ